MANVDHLALVKQGAERVAQWRKEHLNEGLELREADLRGANLQGTDLIGADLFKANLSYVNLREANLQGADLRETNLIGANLREAFLPRADLREATLIWANLQGARLQETNLQGANLAGANLQGAVLQEANLSRTDLKGIKNVYQAYSLETVHLKRDDTLTIEDALYFETCQRRWPERWLDWERLRVVGRLPLFGASYTGLILIPILFYGLALYNDQVELVRRWTEQIRTWAEQTPALPAYLVDLLERLTSLIVRYIHPRPIPQQSLLLFVSTLLLAVGSTLYTFFCPSRVKEFSRDQWCDQLGHSLLYYWPLAWKYRYIRLVCTACYILGGLGALWVLGTKLWRVFVFIFKYSPYPWPWR